MICKKCNNEIDDSATFCTFCGNNVLSKREQIRNVAVKVLSIVCIIESIISVYSYITSFITYSDTLDAAICFVWSFSVVSCLLMSVFYFMILLKKINRNTVIILSFVYLLSIFTHLIFCFATSPFFANESRHMIIMSLIFSIIPWYLIVIIEIMLKKQTLKIAAIWIIISYISDIIISCFFDSALLLDHIIYLLQNIPMIILLFIYRMPIQKQPININTPE